MLAPWVGRHGQAVQAAQLAQQCLWQARQPAGEGELITMPLLLLLPLPPSLFIIISCRVFIIR